MQWLKPAGTAIAAVLALAGVMLAVSAWPTAGQTAARAGVQPSVVARQTVGTGDTDSGPDQEVISHLETDEIYIDPVDEQTLVELGVIDEATYRARAEIAISKARMEMPLSGDAPASADVQRFTDNQYGYESAPDDNAASDVEPIYVDRLVWMVTFQGVEVPVLGPNYQNDASGPFWTQTSNLVVFLDAETYEFLEAVTA
jgi:hypothetical protein